MCSCKSVFFFVLQLDKEKLDDYKDYKEGLIPHFEFNLKLKDIRNQQSFEQKICFAGTETYLILSSDLIPGLWPHCS